VEKVFRECSNYYFGFKRIHLLRFIKEKKKKNPLLSKTTTIQSTANGQYQVPPQLFDCQEDSLGYTSQ